MGFSIRTTDPYLKNIVKKSNAIFVDNPNHANFPWYIIYAVPKVVFPDNT